MEYSALALWLSVQTAAWPVDGKAEAPKAAAKEAPKEENPARQPLSGEGKMPLSGLKPSHAVADLCVYR